MQQLGQLTVAQARQHALKQALFGAPDAVFAQRHGQRTALAHGVFHAFERAYVFGQRVVHQHFGFAFGLQAVKHALHAHALPGQHRLGQLEHVVTRHVKHRAFNLRQRQHAVVLGGGRKQQAQLLNLLVRSEQIAFHPVGKKLQRVLAFHTSSHALALGAQALGNPLRQRLALHRLYLQGHAAVFQGQKPGGGLGGLVQPGQEHDGQGAVVALGLFGQLLQGGAAFLARLAAGDADFDDLLVGKQAQAACCGQHLAPVKMRARHGVGAALGKPLGAGMGAQGI